MPGLPNPWLIVGVLIAFAVVATGSYFKGRHDMDLVYKAAALKAAQQVVKDVVKQNEITAAVAEKAEEKQVEIRTITETIIKEVKHYVPIEVDRNCPIPVGFVGLHDAAAAGRTPVPDATWKPDGPPSTAKLSGVGRTIAGNYGICHAIAEKLIDLQDWVSQQQEAWGKP